ncbi:hypothetical protein AK812_SmicGene27274 [Symbiodinium microadriaticum]|uniref:Uncharacterized protein n=1 Tax=Symbiodinium microadriaticum TaxID=2951 RepID=A0A1Q9D799_SYMMI|nr:hypothetical protein AK812_SmicGene27274 [Symbiodinium microadriaticum]
MRLEIPASSQLQHRDTLVVSAPVLGPFDTVNAGTGHFTMDSPSSWQRSTSSSRFSRSTGKMVVCPCPRPPPVDKTMMARYDKLEDGLRKNWASLHDSDADLKGTRSSASGEVASMEAMQQLQAQEARDAAELEEAQQSQVREWIARTVDKSSENDQYAKEALTSREEPADSVLQQQNEVLSATRSWRTDVRHHKKDPCSPITLKQQAEQRWKCLFGDAGVAYAPPGTGWAAYSGWKRDRFSVFSQSSSYLGLKRGDVFELALRAQNVGTVSSITLPEELSKRITRMRSLPPVGAAYVGFLFVLRRSEKAGIFGRGGTLRGEGTGQDAATAQLSSRGIVETTDQWEWKQHCQIIEFAAIDAGAKGGEVTVNRAVEADCAPSSSSSIAAEGVRCRPQFNWEDIRSRAARCFAEDHGVGLERHKEMICDPGMPFFQEVWHAEVIPFLQRAAGGTGSVVLLAAHNGAAFDEYILRHQKYVGYSKRDFKQHQVPALASMLRWGPTATCSLPQQSKLDFVREYCGKRYLIKSTAFFQIPSVSVPVPAPASALPAVSLAPPPPSTPPPEWTVMPPPPPPPPVAPATVSSPVAPASVPASPPTSAPASPPMAPIAAPVRTVSEVEDELKKEMPKESPPTEPIAAPVRTVSEVEDELKKEVPKEKQKKKSRAGRGRAVLLFCLGRPWDYEGDWYSYASYGKGTLPVPFYVQGKEISTKAPEGNGGKAGKGGKGGKGKAKGGKPSAAAAARASDVCGMERRQSVTAKAPVTPAPAAAESGGGTEKSFQFQLLGRAETWVGTCWVEIPEVRFARLKVSGHGAWSASVCSTLPELEVRTCCSLWSKTRRSFACWQLARGPWC